MLKIRYRSGLAMLESNEQQTKAFERITSTHLAGSRKTVAFVRSKYYQQSLSCLPSNVQTPTFKHALQNQAHPMKFLEKFCSKAVVGAFQKSAKQKDAHFFRF